MYEKTNQGDEPSASAQEAAESQSEPGRTADPQEEPHGDHCRCAYCARELKDDASITAGYGPVCAKKRHLPWGGTSDGQAKPYLPSWECAAFLRRVSRPVLAVAWRVQFWTRRTVLRPARAMLSRARHRVTTGARHTIIPWLRTAWAWCRRTRPVRFVLQQWSRVTPRTRRVALAVCAVSAAIVLVVSIFGWIVDDSPGADLRASARSTAAAGASAVVSHEVSQPALVQVRLGSPQAVWTASARQRRQLAGLAARQILPALDAHPDQVVVIKLRDIPLSFSQLPAADRGEVQRRVGPFAAKRYESAVAALLNATMNAVAQQQPRAVLSVLGLPIEPEEAGVALEIARQSNERYGTVIDALGPFVSARRLVVFGSTLDDTLLARMGMREAVRLRDGRPIVFQLNTAWQALVDSEGLDYQQYVVARASGKIPRHRGATQPGSPESQVQVLLGDDPYSDP